MAKIIELVDVCKKYSVHGKTINALQNINLSIDEGDFIAVVGNSGSGKSTLLNIMGCLDVPSSGNYFLEGIDVSTITEKSLCNLRNKTIGFIFQSFNLISNLSALENVELPLIYRKIKKPQRTKIAEKALESVGLTDRKNHKPCELSGGQRQRVAVARAVALAPKIIFADEPTGNLDEKSRDDVMSILKNLNATGKTVILITHDPSLASLCRKTINISDGRII